MFSSCYLIEMFTESLIEYFRRLFGGTVMLRCRLLDYLLPPRSQHDYCVAELNLADMQIRIQTYATDVANLLIAYGKLGRSSAAPGVRESGTEHTAFHLPMIGTMHYVNTI